MFIFKRFNTSPPVNRNCLAKYANTTQQFWHFEHYHGENKSSMPLTESNPVHPALGCSTGLVLSALPILRPANLQSDRNDEFTRESQAAERHCSPQHEFMMLAETHCEISYPPINSYCVYLTRCTSAPAKSNKINCYVSARHQTVGG